MAHEYNEPFSSHELEAALSGSKNTAPGPDNVHYELLRHLSLEAKHVLLEIYNKIWTTGIYPDSWRLATVIPLLKGGKLRSDVGGYRPIALTSCMSKVLERMISLRLSWVLETHKLVASFQAGFRRWHSTSDHLVRL